MLKKVALGVFVCASSSVASAWQEVAPGGDTTCARGAPFSFFVEEGDPDRVVLDFGGGGACWDASTCDPSSATYTDNVDAFRDGLNSVAGIYRRNNERNPYREWTHVMIPYCTGDVHWGSATVQYKKGLAIEHKGAVNTQAVLSYVKEHFPSASRLLVSGCSAGAYGAVWWTPHVQEMYPAAQVVQFADSGAGILTEKFQQEGLPRWNIVASAPVWVTGLEATQDYTKISLTEFYTKLAAFYPGIHFNQFNHGGDGVQAAFYWKMGGNPLKWSSKMYESIRTLNGLDNFRAYIAGGSEHCATTGDIFYGIRTSGITLTDWLGKVLQGEEPDGVCEDC
jgi:hypothetical protein